METMSTTTIDLDEQTYRRLLGRTLPHVIHTDEECERLTNELMRLDEREDLSAEESELAELLTVLIDEYEQRRYPIRKANPRQTLRHLMEARNLTQKDLWKTFGSKGITSCQRRAVYLEPLRKSTKMEAPTVEISGASHYRARYYDSSSGRFWSEDPLR